MTTVEKTILLSAHKQALKCLQNCMTEAHKFPMAQVQQWWEEAREKVSAIEKLEQQIKEETASLLDRPKAEEPLTGEALLAELNHYGDLVSKTDLALKCGYSGPKGKADYTGFYQALKTAKAN